MSKTIYLLVGASGSGKTMLSQYLKLWGIPEIKSHSTRPMREGERQGNPYTFVTDEVFDQIDFIETTTYAGNRYGTSKQEIERIFNSNDTAFAIVDAHGVKEFKKQYGDTVKTIYIHAPFCTLIQRMKARGDTQENIAARVRHALDSNELSSIDLADYCIINLDLGEAKRQLRCVVGVE
jgi:guanylate kinase